MSQYIRRPILSKPVAEHAVLTSYSARQLTLPQTEVYTSTSKYTCAVAGLGSGKSDVAIQKILTTKFKYPGVNLAYLAPTYPLIRDIFYPRIGEALMALNLKFKVNKTENVIHIQGFGEIYCRTMDKPEYIIGWEVGDCYLDEFDVLPLSKAMMVLQKVTARARQKFPDGKINQLFFTTTPEGFKATYSLFKKPETKLPNSNLIQMSTYSNEYNLPTDYIQTLLDQYPSELIKAYLLGEFVNLTSGSVYPYFDRERHHIDSTPLPGEPIDIGVDFNVRNMAATAFNNRMHIIGEFVGYADTKSLLLGISERYSVGQHKITIFPDASGKNTSSKGATLSDFTLIRDFGYEIKVRNSNPLVKERVMSVNALLDKDELLINTAVCPNMTEAFEQQVYNANGDPDKDSGFDHLTDSAGYRVAFDHLIARPQFFFGQVSY